LTRIAAGPEKTTPINLAVIRHAAFNILKADKSKGSLPRKRLRACIDPKFRSSLFAP
jgi:hypothetical protein